METQKIEKIDATVNIDGAAIKRIREQQALTQLYVAKMVGVTTDTISRWENNRYPTIKRVNAERLAQALEVELHDIVSTQDEERKSQPSSSGRNLKLWFAVSAALICLVVAGVWILWPRATNITAERLLPSYAAPGAVIPVHIRLSGVGGRGVVRETLPPGCELVAALPKPSSIDTQKRLLRWIVQLGDKPLHIFYLLKIDQHAALNSLLRFDGAMVAHSASSHDKVELIGADQLVIAHISWADLNGDMKIDDDEMVEASYLSENMPGVPLDLDSVEALWIEEDYYWSQKSHEFVPGLAGEEKENN